MPFLDWLAPDLTRKATVLDNPIYDDYPDIDEVDEDQANIKFGRLDPETVSFDLREVLDNILSPSMSISDKKKIELAVYISNKVPDVVDDPGRFWQIIINLVRNSTKFTHERHMFISVHLVEELHRQPDVIDRVLRHVPYSVKDEYESVEVVITFEDTGIGIPLDAQKRIFTPYMQGDSSTSRMYGGTGIRLCISKCLVDLIHGEFGFVSEPEKCSNFSFFVPFYKYTADCVEPKLQNQDSAVIDFRGLRALVIDRSGVHIELPGHIHTSIMFDGNILSFLVATHEDPTSNSRTNLFFPGENDVGGVD